MKYLIYIIIAVVAVWLGKTIAVNQMKNDSRKRSKLSKNKEKNKERILDLFKHRDTIVNNDVEKLLGVSDATATNYLQELEDERRLEQVGSTGHAVYYLKL